MMQAVAAAGGDGRGPKKRGPFAGFWMWEAEMERLDQFPRMDAAFVGRDLEGASARQQLREGLTEAEFANARQAWLDQQGRDQQGRDQQGRDQQSGRAGGSLQ